MAVVKLFEEIFLGAGAICRVGSNWIIHATRAPAVNAF